VIRRARTLLIDERDRRAVEVSERYADGGASHEEFEAACVAGDQARWYHCRPEGPMPLWNALLAARLAALGEVGRDAATAALTRADTGEDFWGRCAEEHAQQCVILRDIVVSPFRPARVDPAWLDWEGGTVPRLAAAAYEERAFDRLPILADALEEADCTDADILGHLRGPGPHVRGCWVLDLLLGKD
jgi:hypothetical protein